MLVNKYLRTDALSLSSIESVEQMNISKCSFYFRRCGVSGISLFDGKYDHTLPSNKTE